MNEKKWQSQFIWLAVAAMIAMAVATPFDQSATAILANHKWPFLTDLMGRTLFEGELPGANDPFVLLLLAALVVYILSWRPEYRGKWAAYRPQAGFILISALVVAFLVMNGVKLSQGRARPDLVFAQKMPFSTWFALGPHFIANGPYRGSFPSGHTSQAISAMSLAYILIYDPFVRKSLRRIGWIWGAFILLMSFTMGVARCMSASHWLTDVVGAICLGWLIVHLLYHWLLFVPDQRRYVITHNRFPSLPTAWELRIGGFLLLTTIGAVILVNGLRAIQLHQSLWIAAFIPVGAMLIYWTLGQVSQIRKKIRDSLDLS